MLRWQLVAGLLVAGTFPVIAQDRALEPEQALASWKLPPGFRATLFAAEPAITQPMAFTFDDRGRVWVVECLSYPTWREDGTGHDRVTILEDTDGDGRHDKRTVFFDQGANLSGIEVGFGGVWLTAVPNLIFIPDKNGDDQPDSPPKILLDGWDLKARHNVVGNLAWGPDGWLYGCNGILSNSLLGKPGTPSERRTSMNCGVWRYHPLSHEFEAYAHGTTNPWGLDWNEQGQMFITNCVIKHIFHVVPGAHFERMFGQDINPHAYGLLPSCADHQHWAGGHWTTSRRAQPEAGYAAHSDAGGGHAHSGCMIYLGDNWPVEYRNNAFLVNIHGQRLNRDLLERQGSGYVARHGADFAFSKDPWFRGLHAKYGPDGGVYVSDWSDAGECHDQKEEECDKTGGRIFKIVYEWPDVQTRTAALGGIPASTLASLTDRELVNLQMHVNDWQARHARRLLQERAAARRLDAPAVERLINMARGGRPSDAAPALAEQTISLRALWTLHVTRLLDEEDLLLPLLAHAPDDNVAAWAMTLAVESKRPSDKVRAWLARLAQTQPAPLVRLHIAAALQRIPLAQRWPIAAALLAHEEDADDVYLPLMDWYALEPLVPHETRKAIEQLPLTKIPLVRQYLTRRIVAVYDAGGGAGSSSAWVLDELIGLLGRTSDDAARTDIVRGLCDAFRGRRNLRPPAGWTAADALLSSSRQEPLRRAAREASVIFGERRALESLEATFDRVPAASLADQQEALTLLAYRPSPAFGRKLLELIKQDRHAPVRPAILRTLAHYDVAEIPAALITVYPDLTPAERADAIQTLTVRPAFALALLDAIDRGVIAREDVSALVIRQLQALDDKSVSERLAKVWGEVRPAAADKKERVARLKEQLSPDVLKRADLSRGRVIFAKTCATCHKLFDEGSKLGPELTGSQRHNLDYVLDNVLDPSAIVPRDYKVQILRLADGRVVQGVVLAETPQTLTVQTANETIPIAALDIEARKESPLSMMPEGLFDRLAADDLAALVAYLASPEQVPLPPAEPNVK